MADSAGWSTQQRPPELRRERRFHWLSDLLLESVRRQTYVNWTLPFIDPDQLAKSGFFYLQTRDHVQCAFCQGIVGYWDPGDNPDIEHRKHFPKCTFLSGVATGNVPLTLPADDTGRVYRLLEDYHNFKITSTKPSVKQTASVYDPDATKIEGGVLGFPQFNTPASRKQTFAQWKADSGVSVESLVAAGFFYSGISDWVQCFSCGGGLFGWRKGDDPSADHARFYPTCPFGRTQVGRETSTKPWDDNTPPSPFIRPITLSNEEANLLLAHPIAQRLIKLGLSVGSVKGALVSRLEARGVLCHTVTAALELVFDYEEAQKRNSAGDNLVYDALPNHHPQPQPEMSQEESEAARVAAEMAKQHQLVQEVSRLRVEVCEAERRLLCRSCGVRRVEVALQPCSHLHLCAPCARPLDTCPTCTVAVRGTLRPIIG